MANFLYNKWDFGELVFNILSFYIFSRGGNINMKKISAIIPTYNRAHCIAKSLNSIFEQTYPVSEIIVVDDCSDDDTEEVITKIDNPLIHYYRLSENKGAGGARNYGVRMASGEYIAFLDSDDCWTPDKIEKQMNYFEQHPEVGLVYSRYVFHSRVGIDRLVPEEENHNKLEGNILGNLLLQNTIGAPTVIMRRTVFEEVSGFDENMRSLEDWDFAIKVAKKYPIGYVPNVLLEVTQSANSVSSNIGNYFQSRCSFFCKYRNDYISTKQMDAAMLDVLKMAEKLSVLDQVKKLIYYYLK